MTQTPRLEVYNTILKQKLVPLFFHSNGSVAKEVAGAVAGAGGRLLEFTNRGEGALSVFTDLVEYCCEHHPQLIVGVGSVEGAEEAALFLAHGAQFVVSPVFDEASARFLNRRKVAYLPGCQTLTEIARAEELGAEIVKLFPASSLGPEFVRSALAPRPWSRIMPTGGVTITNMAEWFEAGAVAIGVGSDLIRKEWLATSNFADLGRATAAALDRVSALSGRR